MTTSPTTPDPISQRAYARRRGVSLRAVQRAIKAGRLAESLVWKDGTAKIGDPARADVEWAAKTNSAKLPNQEKVRQLAGDPSAPTPAPAANGSSTDLAETLPAGDVPPVVPSGMTLMDAVIREKHWKAALAELDAKERAGELVEVEVIEQRFADKFAICRTAMLAIPSKAKHAMPHLSRADVRVLDDLIREALTHLATEAPDDRPDDEEA